MRDAIGGTFMIKILIIFLAIYITFVAVALNYAKAFRVKNKIIDIIEQNEGIDDYNDTSGVLGEINDYLETVSYFVPNISNDNGCYERGYCIYEYDYGESSRREKYYKVRTYIKLEFPFFKLSFTIPIEGETRKIVEF